MIPISRGKGDNIELAVSWDFFDGMQEVDLDAQAVLFD
jgi:tellurium resistance protein TerZ